MAAACGSEDGKKISKGAAGGAGGEAGAETAPVVGGGKSDGGEPPSVIPQGGQAPTAMGGAGGEPLVEPNGGAGGEPSLGLCCQPLTCEDVDFECGYADDGCGDYVICNCGPGTQCVAGACEACTADPNICQNHCGEILDNCNTPTTCADNCGESAPGSVCFNGFCCTPLTTCAPGVCGLAGDGCGGTVDCGDPCEGDQVCYASSCCTPKVACTSNDCGIVSDDCGGTLDCSGSGCEAGQCQADGHCCTPNPEACDGLNCGSASDGCGNVVECGEQCAGTTACIGNACQESACKAQGFDCGWVSLGIDNYEACGTCVDGEFCLNNVCAPICR